MLEFMKDINELPEFRETCVTSTQTLDLTASAGWQDLTLGEISAINHKFKHPEDTWEEAFLEVGYAKNPAKVLSKLVMRKPGFSEYKESYIDNMMGGSDIKILEDMIHKATCEDQVAQDWTTKDPIKTKFEIQKYLLENISKDVGKKKESIGGGNFFQFIQNNFKGLADV